MLSGDRPGTLAADLSPRAYPAIAKVLSIGASGEILTRRPDVRAAERRLAAATGREGIAAADLYPRITVSRLSKRQWAPPSLAQILRRIDPAAP